MSCRICGSEEGTTFRRESMRRDYFDCGLCRATTAQMSEQEYRALEPTYDPGPDIHSLDRSELKTLLGVPERLAFLKRYSSKLSANPRVLDVGCGAGGYLIAASELGWSAVGVEPSEAHSKVGKALGLDIRTGYFQASDFPEPEFDLVILSHVIEHIYHPRAFIAELLKVVKPGGLLILITPNIEGIASRVSGRYWVMYKPVDHVTMLGPSAAPFLKCEGSSIKCSTSEYRGEIVVSALAAARDAISERRGGAPTMGVASAAKTSSDGSGWRRQLFQRQVLKGLSAVGAPFHWIAKSMDRQAALVIEIEKSGLSSNGN